MSPGTGHPGPLCRTRVRRPTPVQARLMCTHLISLPANRRYWSWAPAAEMACEGLWWNVSTFLLVETRSMYPTKPILNAFLAGTLPGELPPTSLHPIVWAGPRRPGHHQALLLRQSPPLSPHFLLLLSSLRTGLAAIKSHHLYWAAVSRFTCVRTTAHPLLRVLVRPHRLPQHWVPGCGPHQFPPVSTLPPPGRPPPHPVLSSCPRRHPTDGPLPPPLLRALLAPVLDRSCTLIICVHS